MKNELINFWIWIFYQSWKWLRHDGFSWNFICIYVLTYLFQGINSFYLKFFSHLIMNCWMQFLSDFNLKTTDTRWCIVQTAGESPEYMKGNPPVSRCFHICSLHIAIKHTLSALILSERHHCLFCHLPGVSSAPRSDGPRLRSGCHLSRRAIFRLTSVPRLAFARDKRVWDGLY